MTLSSPFSNPQIRRRVLELAASLDADPEDVRRRETLRVHAGKILADAMTMRPLDPRTPAQRRAIETTCKETP